MRTAIALGCLVSAAPAQQVTYEGALSVATGWYIFTERTTSWSLASALAVEWGRVTVRDVGGFGIRRPHGDRSRSVAVDQLADWPLRPC